MCGIAGIIEYKDTSKNIDKALLKAMTDSLIHRGPDEDGFFIERNVGLSMRRLKIIDLSGGSQPIFNEDKSIAVVFNGEIYNYIELRDELTKRGHKFSTKTDAEIIVHSYEEYGAEHFIDNFRGMFAFALYDKNRQTVLIVRDRFGIKPLYYLDLHGRFYFASEIKSIIADRRVPRELDLNGLSHYLTLDYFPTPFTSFSNIRKLEPAHLLKINLKSGEISDERYWKLPFNRQNRKKEADYIAEFEDIFKDTLRIMLRSDVPLGVFLSSGLDSAAITAFIAKHFNRGINTFTAKFEENAYDESDGARLISEMYGTNHHEILINSRPQDILDKLTYAFDEPNADYGAIPFYYITQAAKKDVTVAFTGNGGDEIFAGYPILVASKLAKIYRKIPGFIRKLLIEPAIFALPASYKKGSAEFRAKRFISGLSDRPEISHLLWKGIFDDERKQLLLKDDIYKNVKNRGQTLTFNIFSKYYNDADTDEELWKLMNIDLNTFLLDDNIAVADRISMSNSMEIRVPFLDHKLAEFAASIPTNILLPGFKTKAFLRKALKKYLPQKIISAKKMGFTPPLPIWLRTSLKDLMLDTLSEQNIDRLGVFNYAYIQELISAHLSGKWDNSRELWGLISLVMWHKKFIDGVRP